MRLRKVDFIMNNNSQKKIFIGAAWPYANGSLHLGHVAGFLGADFLARYYRLKGNKVLFVSGSDCYGTPIAVKAVQENVQPKEIAEKYSQEFFETLVDGVGISYDLYSKTTSSFHHKVVQESFLDLLNKGYIYRKIQNLPYCEKCERFLADRYIEGVCPRCNFLEARGDQCDECSSLLDVKDLINPKCKLCGESPRWKDTEHFFLKLTAFTDILVKWVEKSQGWRDNAKSFTKNILKAGLIDRAITRDSTWGVPIPIDGYEQKCIYVWFEAVCGYLSASKEYSCNIGDDDYWQEFWQTNNSIHYYLHGKDNIPFHTIIWPAILLGLGELHLPDKIISSEYLSFEGKQFSKSRNWGIWLPEFLAKYHPDSLRYFLGVSGPENADTNFSWREFQLKSNSELLGKFGNFVNRVISFTNSNFNGIVPAQNTIFDLDHQFLQLCYRSFDEIGFYIENGKFQKAFKSFIGFTDDCNKYINDSEPWKIIKNDFDRASTIINICIQAVSVLQTIAQPLLPFSAKEIARQLDISERTEWKFYQIEHGKKIAKAKPLYEKVEI